MSKNIKIEKKINEDDISFGNNCYLKNGKFILFFSTLLIGSLICFSLIFLFMFYKLNEFLTIIYSMNIKLDNILILLNENIKNKKIY